MARRAKEEELLAEHSEREQELLAQQKEAELDWAKKYGFQSKS